MTVIVSESLFYEVARVISSSKPISYYQYQGLNSFIETIVLHDKAFLFSGEDSTSDFLSNVDKLVERVENNSFSVHKISSKNRHHYIKQEDIRLFETFCKQIYKYSLGISSDDLFKKQGKDRTAEDMSERIEDSFFRNFNKETGNNFDEEIYQIWLDNANSSELFYFFRAHLFQAIAERRSWTPIFDNQRLLASILHKQKDNTVNIGTQLFTIYSIINSLFVKTCESLVRNQNNEYPKTSILMRYVISHIKKREDILSVVFDLRNKLKNFREHYKEIERVLNDPEENLQQKARYKTLLQTYIEKIWIPTLTSFDYNEPYIMRNIGKTFIEKLGVGEFKFINATKGNDSSSSINYASPTVSAAATSTIVKMFSDVYYDSKLYKPNKELLDVVRMVIHANRTHNLFKLHLDIKDFNYRKYRLIDSNLYKYE